VASPFVNDTAGLKAENNDSLTSRYVTSPKRDCQCFLQKVDFGAGYLSKFARFVAA